MTRNATADESRTETVPIQVDVELDTETWRTVQERARRYARHPGKDAETAFWDAVHETVQTVPNLVVDGDVKGIDDVPRLTDIATGERGGGR